MAHFKEELIFYGDDIKIERFYDDTLMLYAPYTRPAVPDPNATIRHALDHPIGTEPLGKQLNSSSRVLIAFDDPCLPIPLMLKDPRSLIIEEVLRRLAWHRCEKGKHKASVCQRSAQKVDIKRAIRNPR